MIKLLRTQDCKSYFHNDELYDQERVKEFKVSIFGVTIYSRSESYKCDLKGSTSKSLGFKKE